MRLAVFSDIHGHARALEAMLRDLRNRPVDGYIFCGDIAGYFYQPLEAARALLALSPLYAVRGNHDAHYLDCWDDARKTAALAARYGAAYLEKDPALRDLLETLPLTLDLSLDGRAVHIAHGSFDDPLEGRIYPDTAAPLPSQPPETSFFGHTHYRMLRRLPGGALLCNPGSLGQPRGGGDFSYALWDTALDVFTFHRVRLSTEALRREVRLRDPGNHRLLASLETGREDG